MRACPSVADYITAACEEELVKHGDSWRGAGYTRSADEAARQYAMMLEIVRELGEPVTLLDYGCGLAHMLDVIEADRHYGHIAYSGLDRSEKYLAAARSSHPHANLFQFDLNEPGATLPEFDYIVMNGLFNYRGAVSFEDMLTYWRSSIGFAFKHARRGLAFNTMSKLVDWEREDLFHLPFDTMAMIVSEDLGRNFLVRHDYGAYEYTVYVYREPMRRR